MQGCEKTSLGLGVSQVYEYETDDQGNVVSATLYWCQDLDARRYWRGRGQVKARVRPRREDEPKEDFDLPW